MAGMGLQGAYGALGTLQGVQDWVDQRRRRTVQDQRDLLFEQDQEDRRARIQEEGAERAQAAVARDQRATLAQEIDALDLPPLVKLGAKISIAHGKELPPQLYDLLKAKQPTAVDTVDDQGRPVKRFVTPEPGMELPQYVKPEAPAKPTFVDTVDERGRPVQRAVIPEVGQQFPKYVPPREPRQEPTGGYQWVTVPGQKDPLWTNQPPPGAAPFDKNPPQPARIPAAMRQKLVDVGTSKRLLTQLKGLFDGDPTNADPAYRIGAKHYIGPWSGPVRNFKMKLPNVPGMTSVEQPFVQFSKAAARLRNATIQAITGAAVGVQEEARILRELPDENVRPEDWPTAFEQSMRNLEYLEAAIQEAANYSPNDPAPAQPARTPTNFNYDANGNRVP